MLQLRVLCLTFCLTAGFVLAALRPAMAQEQEAIPKPIRVQVAPESEFSISVSDNPSTGYTVALASMDKGVYFLGTDLKPPKQPLPGAPGTRTFHFYISHKAANDPPPEITFARFRRFDFKSSYREETYVLDIRPQPAGSKGRQ